MLSRWSKLFVRSQTLKKQSSKNSPRDLQKERIRKQRYFMTYVFLCVFIPLLFSPHFSISYQHIFSLFRISEILSDESWQSKIDFPVIFYYYYGCCSCFYYYFVAALPYSSLLLTGRDSCSCSRKSRKF